jgi:hypothetical protein
VIVVTVFILMFLVIKKSEALPIPQALTCNFICIEIQKFEDCRNTTLKDMGLSISSEDGGVVLAAHEG